MSWLSSAAIWLWAVWGLDLSCVTTQFTGKASHRITVRMRHTHTCPVMHIASTAGLKVHTCIYFWRHNGAVVRVSHLRSESLSTQPRSSLGNFETACLTQPTTQDCCKDIKQRKLYPLLTTGKKINICSYYCHASTTPTDTTKCAQACTKHRLPHLNFLIIMLSTYCRQGKKWGHCCFQIQEDLLIPVPPSFLFFF